MAHPISNGARCTYVDVCREGEPQVSPAIGLQPQIQRADDHFPQVPVVGSGGVTPRRVYLKRLNNATRAYALTNEYIARLPRGRGYILYAVVYNWNGYAYTAPDPRSSPPQHVVIKQLWKSAILENYARGGVEDPLKEIALLQSLGDNEHVIKPLEALEDSEFLYIITPRGIPLDTIIPWNSPNTLPRERIRSIYRQLLRILQYLEHHNICHRDISPGNLVFLAPDRLVLIDFGFAQRVPVHPMSGRRMRMVCQGTYGTIPFLCPEVFQNNHFDGLFSDHWSVSMILFSLLTNKVLCAYPFPGDGAYQHFIWRRHLCPASRYEGAEVASRCVHVPTYQKVAPIALKNHIQAVDWAVQRLDVPTRRFLGNLLHNDPFHRWTLAQAVESDFLRPRRHSMNGT